MKRRKEEKSVESEKVKGGECDERKMKSTEVTDGRKGKTKERRRYTSRVFIDAQRERKV